LFDIADDTGADSELGESGDDGTVRLAGAGEEADEVKHFKLIFPSTAVCCGDSCDTRGSLEF
jgi:hypothetical protein